MEQPDPTSAGVAQKEGKNGGPVAPAQNVPEVRVRVIADGKPDIFVKLEGIPGSVWEVVSQLGKPGSLWKSLFKDVVPGLTSAAAVLISLAALIYTNHQKNLADTTARDQRERTADATRKKLLGDLITHFPQRTFSSGEEEKDYQAKFQLNAMTIAVYGQQALPAVRMALGSDDDGIREGGIMVAQQMYRAETVAHPMLISELLGYYDSGAAAARRGALAWARQMGRQLSNDEGRLFYQALERTFGPRAEFCAAQDPDVALEAAKFLPIWSFAGSATFALGMVKQCKDDAHPDEFLGAREQALSALEEIARSLSAEQCASLLTVELPALSKEASDLQDLINNAAERIRSRRPK
jgi:hypothetical protein